MSTSPSRSSRAERRAGRGPFDPRVIPFLRPAHRWLGLIVAANTLGGLATIAQAFALGTLVVRLLGSPASTGWMSAAQWLVVLTVVRAACGALSDNAAARAAGQVSIHLRDQVMRAALDQEYDAAARQRAGELGLLATRGVTAVEPYITRYLPALAVAAVLPLSTVAAIASQDWLSAVVVICTLPLVPVFAILIGLATKDRSDRQWRALTALSGHFLDVVRGLPTLVAFRRASAQGGRIRQVTDVYRRTTNETLKVAFLSSAALELIATISVALVAVTVGLRLAHGTLDFQTALVVLLMAPEAYWPLRRVGAEFHAAAEGTSTFAAIAALLAHEKAPGSEGAPAAPFRGPLLIDKVRLGYLEGGDEALVLRDFSTQIEPQGLCAITGPSGCGKSTLLAAILGELPLRGGRIRVGDTSIHADIDQWRTQVAHVGQRPWIVTGTIADNVLIGRPEASSEEVRAALTKVDLDLDPETEVGEDGRRLSAGQRARLALARVVISRRPWIVLDEPTAHLDVATEQTLLNTLTDLARTRAVIVVAHREAVVAVADQVVDLPQRRPRTETRRDFSRRLHRTPVAPMAEADPAPISRARGLLGVLLATMASGFGVALTATAGWLIARAAEQPPVLYLMVAIVSVRLFGLGRPALRYLERLVTHDDALRLLADRRATVYDVLVPLSPARLGRRRGDLLTSIVDDVDALVDERLRVRLPRLTWLALTAVASLIAALIWASTGLALALICLIGGLLAWWVANRSAARHEPGAVRARADLSAAVVDTVSQARSLVLWQRDGAALHQIRAIGQTSARAVSGSALGLSLGRAIALVAGGVGVVVMALLLVPPLSRELITGPAAALVLLLPIAMVDVLSPLADAGSLAVRTHAAQARVDTLADIEPAVIDPASPVPLGRQHPEIEVAGASASWGEGEVLHDLDLHLPPGHRLGIVGPSGCGKSTLAALLMKFIAVDRGTHRLGGVAVADLAGDEVRRVTALVDDDPYIFSSTVAENIRLARPDATDKEIEEVVGHAHLDSWLDRLPRGLGTRLGEGAQQVSGGERARLGLARALLAAPEIMVLDEPTAHLDTDTAHAVSDDLLAASQGRSVVWITHTTVGLEHMDAVLRLGD